MVILLLKYIFKLFVLLNYLIIISAKKWDEIQLDIHPPLKDPLTLDDIKTEPNDIVQVSEWGCLTNSHNTHHNTNGFAEIDYNRTEAFVEKNFLQGTTIWVNEHMAVGHVMYDIPFIQAMQSTNVRRIVLQRSICNDDHCMGVGTWNSFFLGYYTAMIDAFRPGIPVYMRYTWHDTHANPVFPCGDCPTGYIDPLPKMEFRDTKIHLHNWKCGERYIRRKCYQCYHKGISISAVVKFKKAAYKLVKTSPPLVSYFNANEPIVVTLCYRAKGQRHIRNIDVLIKLLNDNLSKSLYTFNHYDTSNNTILYQTQIDWVGRSHIVISEHGAFQSNLIYMRRASLLIDLRGNYTHGEFNNFEQLAKIFGVYMSAVITTNLDYHRTPSLEIKENECQQVLDLIYLYSEEKPYSINYNS